MFQELLVKPSKDHPNKEAVVCGPNRISYLELENASIRLANFLTLQGVEHGDRVGIYCNKNIEEVIVILALIKIGAIFVYINPQYKEEQLSHVIDDCDIKIIFVDGAKSRIIAKAYPEKSSLNIVIATSSVVSLNQNVFSNIYYLYDILNTPITTKLFANQISENDPASIIYTSGSTGMAKGIIVTHRIFYDSTVISASVLNNNANDRLISVTPFSFDGALSQLFTMFLVGGTLVQQPSSFPKDIVTTLLNEKITGFHAVPSLWNIMLQKHSPFSLYEYPDLDYVSIIGENLPLKYLDSIRTILKKAKVFKMYGTTEAFRSTYLPPQDINSKPLSVGIPFPGVDISIVDEENMICQTGEVGEIVHKGVFISPGYWNHPSETAEVFKDDCLHTGDLGKLDDDGYLCIIGRKDSMIKTQGYRVSPGEIEDCIYRLDGVQDVAVLSIPGEEIGQKIKAVIVCQDRNSLTSKDIINYCRNKIPHYMIPTNIEFRKALPRTANNKINKLELN